MARSRRREDRAFRPWPESCEERCLLSLWWAPAQKDIIRAAIARPGYTQVVRPNTIGVPFSFLGTPAAKYASFVDPSVTVQNGVHVVINHNVLVAPFALLDASNGFTRIGISSEIADSARLIANPTRAAGAPGIEIGDQTLIGANATVLGPSVIGTSGDSAATTVVGAGALIDGATIEPGAIVSQLARVGPGVVVPTGFRVLPGKNVTTNAEASDPAIGKVVDIRGPNGDPYGGDITSLPNATKELSASSALASGYATLYAGNSSTVLGSGPSPGASGATPAFRNPKFNFLATSLASPQFRGRATGAVVFGTLPLLLNTRLGFGNSFRADEGQPINITSIARTGSHLVVRAPVSGNVNIGGNFTAGNDVVILGGPYTPASGSNPAVGAPARLGDNVTIGSGAIINQATIGARSTIGSRAYVFRSTLPAGSTVPPGTILVQNQIIGTVEW